ncbi:hypothetical protein ACFX5U_20475 [Sphingobacterium sp. SG20118]|uniref:hypothetical protein n=1 Tax=Sphingobacterium sp. SG20118 TaxID=3367156 RepID=UPI0037DFC1CF
MTSNAVTISLTYSPHNLITLKNGELPVIGLFPKPVGGDVGEEHYGSKTHLQIMNTHLG